MENKFYTTIKVSESFCQKQLLNQILSDSKSKIIRYEGNEIQIESIDRPPELCIYEFCRLNPDETLVATFSMGDHFENLVTTYKYQKLNRELVKEGYEYCVVIDPQKKSILSDGVYESIKKIATEYFNSIDNYRVRLKDSDPSFSEEPITLTYNYKEADVFPSVEFFKDGFKIQAKKFGLTFLMISLDRVQFESSPRDDDHLSEEFDDWMSEEYSHKCQENNTSLKLQKNNCINNISNYGKS